MVSNNLMSRFAENTPWVLFVDDNPQILEALRGLAEAWPDLRVETAPNAEEALRFLVQSPPGLLVSDYSMGPMNGAELILAFRQAWPDLRCVLFTGTQVEDPGPSVKLLQKPLSEADLCFLEDALRAVAEGRPEALRSC